MTVHFSLTKGGCCARPYKCSGGDQSGRGQRREDASGLQVAQQADDAARALQQAVEAAPRGGQPPLHALRALCELCVLCDRLAVHLERHAQQGLRGKGGRRERGRERGRGT